MDNRVSQMFFGRNQRKKDENYHRNGYHRYFEDYIERTVKTKNGKTRIERVYAGSYFVREGSDRSWIAGKIVYLLLFLLSAVCFVIAGTRMVYSNMMLLTIIPQILSVLGMLMLFSLLVCYAGTARRMKRRTWRLCGNRMRLTMLVNMLLLLLSAVLAAFCGVFLDSAAFREEMITALLFAAAGGLVGIIYLMERRVNYREEPGDVTVGEND
ncbi:MAG: hypothetical protein LUH07_15035, partial [Lachnospiraceae bacterium]|nr:hypothetical protein [Lachnospiraceae bacterium]